MKKFILRFLIFAAPFAALVFIEVFVLPLDFFTFRIWEAVKVDTLTGILPGYFYPRVTISKDEQGDIAHHTAFAVMRRVTWNTDRSGYRNRQDITAPVAVVIGDSHTVGAGLTQRDIISEALGRSLREPVYALAPGSINTLLREPGLMERLKVVVISSAELEIPGMRSVKAELLTPPALEAKFWELKSAVKENGALQSVMVPIDRIFKANMLNYCRASLKRAVTDAVPRTDAATPRDAKGLGISFLHGVKALRDVPPGHLARSVEVLTGYRDLLQKAGLRFIFLPVPSKENIYRDLLPSGNKPAFLDDLTKALREKGVETIDMQRAYDEAYREKGPVLYQRDDTHWSAEGVRIAADLLADAIRNGPGEAGKKR